MKATKRARDDFLRENQHSPRVAVSFMCACTD